MDKTKKQILEELRKACPWWLKLAVGWSLFHLTLFVVGFVIGFMEAL